MEVLEMSGLVDVGSIVSRSAVSVGLEIGPGKTAGGGITSLNPAARPLLPKSWRTCGCRCPRPVCLKAELIAGKGATRAPRIAMACIVRGGIVNTFCLSAGRKAVSYEWVAARAETKVWQESTK